MNFTSLSSTTIIYHYALTPRTKNTIKSTRTSLSCYYFRFACDWPILHILFQFVRVHHCQRFEVEGVFVTLNIQTRLSNLYEAPHSCRKHRTRTCHHFHSYTTLLLYITDSLSPSSSFKLSLSFSLSLWNFSFFSNHGNPNTVVEGWAWHSDPNHKEPRLPRDVEAVLPAIPPHHCAGWWPFKDHQGPWWLWLWALQPQWHQQDLGPQGFLHLLQGLCMPLLWLHGLQEEVHLHHWWWLFCKSIISKHVFLFFSFLFFFGLCVWPKLRVSDRWPCKLQVIDSNPINKLSDCRDKAMYIYQTLMH